MAEYITNLDVSLYEAEEKNLQSLGFKKINVDLNKGAGGNKIYLWYKKEQDPAPITKLQVTFTNKMADGLINVGYAKIDKNLNAGAGGDNIYLWYFKGSTEYDTPIVELDALTDLKVSTNYQEYQSLHQQNYMLVSVDLNQGTDGNQMYMWYKTEGIHPIKGITLLVNTDAVSVYERAGVNVITKNLNTGNKGNTEYLCYHQ